MLTFDNIMTFEQLLNELQGTHCSPYDPHKMFAEFIDRKLAFVVASSSVSKDKEEKELRLPIFKDTLALLHKLCSNDLVSIALKFYGSQSNVDSTLVTGNKGGAEVSPQLSSAMKLELLEASLASLKQQREHTASQVATLEALFAVQNAIAYVHSAEGGEDGGSFDASVVAMLKDSSSCGDDDRSLLATSAVQWALCLGTNASDVLRLAKKLRLVPGRTDTSGVRNGTAGGSALWEEQGAMDEQWLFSQSSALFHSLGQLLLQKEPSLLRREFVFCCETTTPHTSDGQWSLCQKAQHGLVQTFQESRSRSVDNLILKHGEPSSAVWDLRHVLLMMGNVYMAIASSRCASDDDGATGARIGVSEELKRRFWAEAVQAFLHLPHPPQLGNTGNGLARKPLWGKAVAAQMFLELLRTCPQGVCLLEQQQQHVEEAMVFNEFLALVGDEWPEEQLSVDVGAFQDISTKTLLFVQLCQSASGAAKQAAPLRSPASKRHLLWARLEALSAMLCRWEQGASTALVTALEGAYEAWTECNRCWGMTIRPKGRALLSQVCAVLSLQSIIGGVGPGPSQGRTLLNQPISRDDHILDFSEMLEGWKKKNPSTSSQLLPSSCQMFPSPFSKCWANLYRLLASKGGVQGRHALTHLVQGHAFGALSAAHEATLVKAFDSKGFNILARKMQLLSPSAKSVRAALDIVFSGVGDERGENTYLNQIDAEFTMLALSRCNVVGFWSSCERMKLRKSNPRLVSAFLENMLGGLEMNDSVQSGLEDLTKGFTGLLGDPIIFIHQSVNRAPHNSHLFLYT